MSETAEKRLNDILRIMSHDDFDEETMRKLSMYVASRGLLKNYYYSSMSIEEITKDIDKFLETLPLLESDEENPTH